MNAGAAALIDPDQRATSGGGEIDDLGDLGAVDLTQRAAEDAHVLTEDADGPAMYRAHADDHAVAVRTPTLEPERGAAVPGELVHLGEGALVEQGVDAFPGRQLAAGMLLHHRLRT